MAFRQNGPVITHHGEQYDGESFAVRLDDESILYCNAKWRGNLWSAHVDRNRGNWAKQIDQRIIVGGGEAGHPLPITCLLRGARFTVQTCIGKVRLGDIHIIGLVSSNLAAA